VGYFKDVPTVGYFKDVPTVGYFLFFILLLYFTGILKTSTYRVEEQQIAKYVRLCSHRQDIAFSPLVVR
jgi:hypothetical protein